MTWKGALRQPVEDIHCWAARDTAAAVPLLMESKPANHNIYIGHIQIFKNIYI